MRRLVIGTFGALGLFGFVVAGCGDDDPVNTGGSTPTTTTTTTDTGGSGGSVTTGGEGGGGAGEPTCTEISADFAFLGSGMFGLPLYYGGDTSPALGAALDDWLVVEVWDGELTGQIDLSSGDEASYATCNACVLVYEDIPSGEGAPARTFFHQSGTLSLGATSPYYIAGSFTDVTLVEVTIDNQTYEATPVPGGACLHITSMPFNVEPPAVGWTCNPLYYDAGPDDGCDCECGAVDPDCDIAGIDVYGCYEGQSCDANAECEGTPTAWTCDPASFDGGDGCHCGCGVPDPDCVTAPDPVIGCEDEQVCAGGYCVPPTWTCPGSYYDAGQGDGCDCACGAPDPDCTNFPADPVYGCQQGEVCSAEGLCEAAP